MRKMLLGLVLLAGCGEVVVDPADTGAADTGGSDPAECEAVAQLDAVTVTAEPDSEQWHPVDWSGDISVEGGDGTWELVFSEGGGSHERQVVHVTSPGRSDLSVLDGRAERVQFSASGLPSPDAPSLYTIRVYGDRDELLYFATPGDGGAAAAEAFGEGFGVRGDAIGNCPGERRSWTYLAISFETDEGTVEMRPGEARTLTVGGVPWRVAVAQAYEVVDFGSGDVDCAEVTEVLGWEALRLDAPGKDEELPPPAQPTLRVRSCG